MSEYRRIANLRPRIHAGNTRTAPAGEQAVVHVRGNSADPILDFHIPRGEVGGLPDIQIGNVRSVSGPAAAHLRGTTEKPILDLDLPRGLNAENVDTADEAVSGLVGTSGTDTHEAVEQVANYALDARSVDFVQGMGVRRVVATKDAEHPISDGDLLLLLETPTFFEDFSSSQVGEVPFEWTPRWVYRPGGYEVVEHQGRRVLQSSWNGSERRLITWDALDLVAQDYSTVEIAWKWRSENRPDLVRTRGLTHGSGGEGNETGYTAGRSSDGQHTLASYQDGSANSFSRGDAVVNPNAEEWWVTRFRVEEGERMVARSWRHGFPEPTGWAEVSLQTSFPRGFIGVVTFGAGRTQYDWFSAAFDGGRAPLGA